MSDEVRRLIGPQTDSHTIDTAAMARRHDDDAGGCGCQMPRRLTTVPEVFRVTTVR